MSESPKKPIELGDLLKLKRHESPDADFWEQFEHDFERRRLQALITADSVIESEGSGRWLRGLLMGSAGLVSASAAVWILLFQVGGVNLASLGEAPPKPSISVQMPLATTEEAAFLLAENEAASRAVSTKTLVAYGDAASAEFIVDALTAEPEPRGFESVHANPVFSQQASSSAQFVFDSYSQGDRFETTFAVERAIARF